MRKPGSVLRRLCGGAGIVLGVLATGSAAAQEPGAAEFAREVDMRLEIPAPAQSDYAARLEAALAGAGLALDRPQYVVLVDRSRFVQAAFLYWGGGGAAWRLVGAAPVSTGQPGAFEHFLTPLGVFEHSPANMDFRAEGTRNSLGVLGYGRRGMRVFDFGWVEERRTWGARDPGPMRLQMHATDPDLLEPLLGNWHSKGCIRIPAGLNRFLDRHGVLDAAYEEAVREGERLWVLAADREPTATPGRWLVVVDSGANARPSWSPAPSRRPKRSPSRAAARSAHLLDAEGRVLRIAAQRGFGPRFQNAFDLMLGVISACLEAAFGSMSDGICIADAAGRFVKINAALARFNRFGSMREGPRRISAHPALLEMRDATGEARIGVRSFAPIRDARGATGV